MSRAAVDSKTQKAVPHAPLPYDGNGEFSNKLLIGLLVAVPFVAIRWTPFVRFGFWTYILYFLVWGAPVTVGFWWAMSRFGRPRDDPLKLPGRPQSDYIRLTDPELKKQYDNKKIPMTTFHDAYFAGKADFVIDPLEALEYRHDWANFHFTYELFKFVLTQFAPEVLLHTRSQDEEQVRDHYDRGDDFYEWFLGPRMIYTSGVSTEPNSDETLEQLQDNKLALVCHKLNLSEKDTLLDIGCGWGTLAAYAGKNFGCDVTGVTLGKNQTKFGNDRLRKNGVPEAKGRILCSDYRDIKGKFSRIVSLEMAEHVGVRHYDGFLNQVYNMLEDDGTFVFQVAGLRPSWKYEDLVWGLFMNKYIFPGADASASLGWVISHLEGAGFEVKNIDVIGVHYSATIWRWYKNWLSNKDKIVAKYGERWYRIWVYFLASSTIVAREGGSSCFQITLHKNLNTYRRIEGVSNHSSLFPQLARPPQLVE